MAKALLFDASKCTACRGCQAACKQWWELPGTGTTNTGSYENPPDLSSETWLKIKFNEVKEGDKVRWVFTRQSCMHCTEAVCVWVCPTGARQYNEQGGITIDQNRCIACGRCATYCPFSIPRFGNHNVTWRLPAKVGVPKMVTYQCILCPDRIQSGQEPACAKTCPTDAIIFGERSELVEKGKARVSAIKAKYPDAYLYGENELGGLHVMYILTDKPTVHGLPESPKMEGTYPEYKPNDFPAWYRQAVADETLSASPENAKPEWYMQPKLVFPPPAPRLTFNKDLATYSALAVLATGVGGVTWWIIKRRMGVQK
ncbi:MAG: 4Fe-4S dicluster domain-containing protein [Chloroflexota bacterium]